MCAKMKVVSCPARGVRFISGIASRYEDNYPIELEGHISGNQLNLILMTGVRGKF
jgi:hypothetical protein